MATNETKSDDEIPSIGAIDLAVAPALEAQAMGDALRKVMDSRNRRKRQVSIMGAKQSITFSLRKRYIERARITAEYMGISMSTYMERCINKDNARYQRIINVLGQEVRKHDEIMSRLSQASKRAGVDEDRGRGVNDDILLAAVGGIKVSEDYEDDVDLDSDQE